MRFFRSLWAAFRAALLATCVFWVATYIVDKSGWQVPFGLTSEAVFFALFFIGVLMVNKG